MRVAFLPRFLRLALLLLVSVGPASSAFAQPVFNVKDYGAVGDGASLETAAFARAIAACVGQGGGTVYVPPGRYLTGTVRLQIHVTLHVEAGATLLGSSEPADYPDTTSPWGDGTTLIAPLIYAEDAENICLTGRGTIDGQGRPWWLRLRLSGQKKGFRTAETPEEKAEVAKLARGRPRLIRLVRCRDVLIERLRLRNAADWTVHPMLSDGIRVSGVSILADEDSHNTDGINPESCRDVQITDCHIDTGDDCITLKSGLDALGRRAGRPTENVTISQCIMRRGHGGVTIGSEMSGGVRNVTISNCVFKATDIGLRIKSQRGRGGVVENVLAAGIVMEDVPVPFTVTTFYTGADKVEDVHPVDEGTPIYRNFRFSHITARGAKKAGVFTGLREMPLQRIALSHIDVDAETGYEITHVDGLTFLDCTVSVKKGPAASVLRSVRVDTAGLRVPAGTEAADSRAD